MSRLQQEIHRTRAEWKLHTRIQPEVPQNEDGPRVFRSAGSPL